jgi:GT2 family glycosyltransferase
LGAVSSRPTVAAVVVTRDRLDQLKRCVTLIEGQTRPVDELIVVDNDSSDGTGEYLAGRNGQITVISLSENVGGAGGFHRAIEEAWSRGHEWIWLMDDDTAPTAAALEVLLDAEGSATGRGAVMLASRVLWTDDSLHPMNLPTLKPGLDRPIEDVDSGLVPLRATSFVSCLMHRSAVDRHGLPHAEYFIWNDDVEFTARVLRGERGYWVPDSVVYHETKTAHLPVTSSLPRYFYDLRNRIWMLRGEAWSTREKATIVRSVAINTLRYLRQHRLSREALAVVGRGLREGLFRPYPRLSEPSR